MKYILRFEITDTSGRRYFVLISGKRWNILSTGIRNGPLNKDSFYSQGKQFVRNCTGIDIKKCIDDIKIFKIRTINKGDHFTTVIFQLCLNFYSLGRKKKLAEIFNRRAHKANIKDYGFEDQRTGLITNFSAKTVKPVQKKNW